MRLQEFANAEEQMKLWKLISDSVWQGIRMQAIEQEKTLAASQKKQKKTRSVPKMPKKAKAVSPLPAPKPPKQKPSKKQEKSVKPGQERPLAQQQGQQALQAASSKTARSNLAAPQTPMSSAASLATQNAAKNKQQHSHQAAPLAQKQVMPAKEFPNAVRSNLAAPQTPVTSAASVHTQNAAKAQSVAQVQRQLDPLAHDATVKRLTR